MFSSKTVSMRKKSISGQFGSHNADAQMVSFHGGVYADYHPGADGCGASAAPTRATYDGVRGIKSCNKATWRSVGADASRDSRPGSNSVLHSGSARSGDSRTGDRRSPAKQGHRGGLRQAPRCNALTN